MVFFEAAQTLEEVASVPKLVNGPCLLNVVRGGKTPEVNLLDAEKMGYRMAIVPGLLMKSFIGIGDAMLAELKRTHVHPTPSGDPTVRQVFNRFGANEWDELRTRFRDDAAKIKAAE
jgi:2-methylisocitrate lyase-like PEP mutase family enzyme